MRKWSDRGAEGFDPLSAAQPVEEQLDEFLGVRVAPGDGPAGDDRPQVGSAASVIFKMHAVVSCRVVHLGCKFQTKSVTHIAREHKYNNISVAKRAVSEVGPPSWIRRFSCCCCRTPVKQVTMYFSCEGVKHTIVHGPNAPAAVWAASAGGADPAFLARLGGTTKRAAAPKVATDHRPVEERMEEVTSIASTMNDLDSALTSWLSRLKPS